MDHLGIQLVVRTILKDAATAGPWNSAKVAIEGHEFRKAIQLFEPHAAQLDETGLVQLALGYESSGRTEDVIKLLEDHGTDQTDAMGTFAGRLKRKWLLERRREDYESRPQTLFRCDALCSRSSIAGPGLLPCRERGVLAVGRWPSSRSA